MDLRRNLRHLNRMQSRVCSSFIWRREEGGEGMGESVEGRVSMRGDCREGRER